MKNYLKLVELGEAEASGGFPPLSGPLDYIIWYQSRMEAFQAASNEFDSHDGQINNPCYRWEGDCGPGDDDARGGGHEGQVSSVAKVKRIESRGHAPVRQ